MKQQLPFAFIVVKVLGAPIDEELMTDTQQTEFNRMFAKSETTETQYKARNFGFSDIDKIFLQTFRTVELTTETETPEGRPIHNCGDFSLIEFESSVLSWQDFVTRLAGIQESGKSICWVTYNGLIYDLPRINYEIIRTGADANLIPTPRYSLAFVFDIMQWVHCWNISNGLLVTCEAFGIPTNVKYTDKDYIEKVYAGKVNKEEFMLAQGSYISKLLLKTARYYFQ